MYTNRSRSREVPLRGASLPHQTFPQVSAARDPLSLQPVGQIEATPANGTEEAGYHHVRFDGSGLASGVYFYRLTAGEYVKSRRFVLRK